MLYCDGSSVEQSRYIVFEVQFGPGRLGIGVVDEKRVLHEGHAPVKCVCVEKFSKKQSDDDGPATRVPLFRKQPVVLSVNGE